MSKPLAAITTAVLSAIFVPCIARLSLSGSRVRAGAL